MAMSEATLATELESGFAGQSTEAAAITALAQAYANYASDAEANGNTILSGAITTAQGVMETALAGMSNENAALTIIPAAIVAFWGSIAATPNLAFTGCTAVTPPPHTTLVADFAATIADNFSNEYNLATAVAAIATDFHTGATTGGTATFPGPTVANIT